MLNLKFYNLKELATVDFFEIVDPSCDLLNLYQTAATKKYNRVNKVFCYQITFLKFCYAMFDRLEAITKNKKPNEKKM